MDACEVWELCHVSFLCHAFIWFVNEFKTKSSLLLHDEAQEDLQMRS